MSDPRLLRKRGLRGALFHSQGGVCAGCGASLEAGWHADHTTPFRIDPTTNVHRMRALCPRCNLAKGGKIVVAGGGMHLLRPWQQEFVRVCGEISPANRQIIVHAVPASGKGSVPYLLVGHAPRSMVQAVCHVVPRLNLRTQSGSPSPWLQKYFLAAGMRPPTIRAADNVTPFRRGADGYAICWDSIQSEPDLHWQEFENVGGYALVIDEPQMLSADGVTARALAPLVEKAACLVMMSGTFMRGDRKPIPFLPYRTDPEGEVIDYTADGWTTVRYARRDALRDQAILPIEFTLRDARARFVKGGTAHEFASFAELDSEDDQRAGLYAVLSDHGGWDIAQEMLVAWDQRRRSVPSAQALIVTHSQPAAKDYRERIKRLWPAADVRIAISEMPGSHDTLRDFRKGKGDILITVGMAYVGFDAPCISHIALLTYIRQRAWIEQAISRGARVDPSISYAAQRCVVYAPNDMMLRVIVREIEAEQEETLVDPGNSPDRERGPTPERDQTVVLDVALTDTASHELNVVSLTAELTGRLAKALADNGLTGTPAQLLHAMNATFGADPLPFVPNAPVMGIKEQEDILRDKIEMRCRSTDASRGMPFGTTNAEMLRHFRVARPSMSIEQLTQALAWLDRNYPVAA